MYTYPCKVHVYLVQLQCADSKWIRARGGDVVRMVSGREVGRMVRRREVGKMVRRGEVASVGTPHRPLHPLGDECGGV